ncbi:MAG: sodium/glutamate symporter [Pseudomonadota bacterium]
MTRIEGAKGINAVEWASNGVVQLNDFVSLTIGIIVLFVGMAITKRVAVLKKYNIPEAVTGGIVASGLILAIYLSFDVDVAFSFYVRDILLIYFFTSIGINARFAQLIAGGKPLLIFLFLTLTYLTLQDVVGTTAAMLMEQPSGVGLLVGSASLAGGHGTAIAWAPTIAADQGVTNALEIGVSAATIGLIMASLLGGPIASFLIARHNLTPEKEDEAGTEPSVGIELDKQDKTSITHINLMGTILLIHIAMILGVGANTAIEEAGLTLPLFVPCMLIAILMTNTIPVFFRKVRWPTGSNALALVADFSLGLFIAMSLMGMKLWEVAGLAGPLFGILGAQIVVAVLFIVLVVFPVMGRCYLAAVLSSGFAGFSLGATPTAIANMSAVTKTHGPAPLAFIILPLVGAFFVDVANAFLIQFFLSL